MNQVTIKTKYGVIIVEEDESGRGIVINIDAAGFKGQKFGNFTVNCFNAGSPGIIGPDVDFNVGNTVWEIVEIATKVAAEGLS